MGTTVESVRVQDDLFRVPDPPTLLKPEGMVANDERSAIFKYTIEATFPPTHKAENVVLAVDAGALPAHISLTGVGSAKGGAPTTPPVTKAAAQGTHIPVTKARIMKYTYADKSTGTAYTGELVERGGKYFKEDGKTELKVTKPQPEVFFVKVRTGIFANLDAGSAVVDDGQDLGLSAALGPVAVPVRVECDYRKVVKEDKIIFDPEKAIEFEVTD